MKRNDKGEYISIPRKLLERIYQDYILFDSTYFTDLEDESFKINEGNYWYTENDETREILNRIEFYLYKGEEND